jgi:hypothetical protein
MALFNLSMKIFYAPMSIAHRLNGLALIKNSQAAGGVVYFINSPKIWAN